MAIRTKRFPEHGVTVLIARGAPSPEDVRSDIRTLEAADAAPRWINYLDPTLDLSALDVASIPSLRRFAAAKLRELNQGLTVVTAWVGPSGVEEAFRRFWPSYVGRDPDYPTHPAAFASIEAAYDWLGLSNDACAAVTAAIRAETGGPRPLGRVADASPRRCC